MVDSHGVAVCCVNARACMHGVCVPPYGRVCVAVNGIGAEGARSLSEALKCCSDLRELDLSGELAVLLRAM